MYCICNSELSENSESEEENLVGEENANRKYPTNPNTRVMENTTMQEQQTTLTSISTVPVNKLEDEVYFTFSMWEKDL